MSIPSQDFAHYFMP